MGLYAVRCALCVLRGVIRFSCSVFDRLSLDSWADLPLLVTIFPLFQVTSPTRLSNRKIGKQMLQQDQEKILIANALCLRPKCPVPFLKFIQ